MAGIYVSMLLASFLTILSSYCECLLYSFIYSLSVLLYSFSRIFSSISEILAFVAYTRSFIFEIIVYK